MHRRQRIIRSNSRGIVYFSLLLVVVLALQVDLGLNSRWFPDLVLLAVVFSGIYGGSATGLAFGLAAGVLRGLLSPYTFPVDVVVFPVIGTMAAVLSKTFYRHSPLTHMMVTAMSMAFLLISHFVYFTFADGEFPGFIAIFSGAWKVTVVTVMVAPLVFIVFRRIWAVER